MIIINPISPVAIDLFGLEIRWYALAYIAAFLVGYWMFKKLTTYNSQLTTKQVDDLLTYCILGTIVGGRLGYVLFYNLSYYLVHPLEIFAIWQGGMAFHGGLIGVIVAVFLFVVKNNSSLIAHRSSLQNAFSVLDVLAIVAPVGIFFGRIANFINMEIMGRLTDGPLGVVFAGAADQVPRHASPLYQAGLEGLLLFAIMFALWRFTKLRERAGALSGAFLIGYSVMRIIGEQFRAPDAHIGFIAGDWLTMGMLLSAVMFAVGIVVLCTSFRRAGRGI